MVWLIGWLPFYSTITDVTTRVWVANLLFSIYNLFGFNNNLETCTQNISPNMRERIFVRSYPIKLSHLFQSILAIILPAIIDKCPNDWADIAVFKWIQTIVSLLDSLGNGMLAFTTILYLYTFRLTGLTYSLIVALVSFAGTPPDLFTPYFIKRFTYKQVMIFYQLSRAVCYSIIVCC